MKGNNLVRYSNSGFTLVEVLVAMVFFLICSVGLLTFTMMSLSERKSIERRIFAYSMLSDVVERLRNIPDSKIVKPNTSHESNYIEYSGGKVKTCGSVSEGDLDPWEFVNPVGSGQLYLYDSNHDGELDSGDITSDNANIDHPTLGTGYSVSDYSGIAPIRKDSNGRTYYAVWSIRYFPCGYSSQAKIFAAVYWIEPEPSDSSSEEVVSKINSGVYRLKHVTVTTDRMYGVSR
ncbi:MAG: prepilin-type N-terminal cleavage/methylation domain-containing protein [archaeon YNP-LCB-024-027]|nr:prepilin-type N-terminal cleavage/methylation domain-containing protein [Candidatus Culexarchaeum yellowstonense]